MCVYGSWRPHICVPHTHRETKMNWFQDLSAKGDPFFQHEIYMLTYVHINLRRSFLLGAYIKCRFFNVNTGAGLNFFVVWINACKCQDLYDRWRKPRYLDVISRYGGFVEAVNSHFLYIIAQSSAASGLVFFLCIIIRCQKCYWPQLQIPSDHNRHISNVPK